MRVQVRKIGVKILVRGEKGYILILALLVLVVVGLISGPVLSYMVSGLRAGHIFETGAAELYAADAGVEDAVWKIQHPDEAGYLPCSAGNPPRLYNITDVNGRSVQVSIESVYAVENMTFIYRVLSTATSNGSGTEIEAYVNGVNEYGDYAGLLSQIVTTQGIIDEQGKQYLNYTPGHEPVENYNGPWPTPRELKDFYWQDVKSKTPYTSGTIDIDGVDTTKGPLYRNGTLEIKNSSNTPATLTLNGTLYITGDTLIGTTGKDFTLDLKGNTIFVGSNTTGSQKALWIGTKVSIKGPGCIIAVGDIYFEPKAQVTTEPVFVLSVVGQTLLQPGGNIYGAVAGSVEVQLQPNTHLAYPTGGFGDLNFLAGIQRLAYSIDTWKVSRL